MISIDAGLFTNNFSDSMSSCLEGITGNDALKLKISRSHLNWDCLESVYSILAENGYLSYIGAMQAPNNKDPRVMRSIITRSEFIKLYSQYFASKGKPARDIYNEIMISANEDCPYCGGIGDPSNLDHYLPKKYYPQYSVLPSNLVPTCLDCNMKFKGSGYAKDITEQSIHPYFDGKHFFEEQWVHAKCVTSENGEVVRLEYFVSAPNNWSEVDAKRVEKHFCDFKIKTRYEKQAGRVLNTTLSQINRNLVKNISREEIVQDLLLPGIEESEFINHWSYGFHQALIQWILV